MVKSKHTKGYSSAKVLQIIVGDDAEAFETSSNDSEGISEHDSNQHFSSDEHTLTCLPDTPEKIKKTPCANLLQQSKDTRPEKAFIHRKVFSSFVNLK